MIPKRVDQKRGRHWSYYPMTFLMMGICTMAILTQACTRSSPRGPSSIEPKPTLSPSSHSNIEQQLLKTVEGAERLGKGNPLVLSSLYSLATYYRSQQQYDKAEEQYQKALQIKEELSGPDHPDIVIILNNYANLLREAKRYAEAESLASRAATILTKNSPPLSTKPRSK